MNLLTKLTAAVALIGASITLTWAAEPIQIASIAGLEGKVMIHKGKNYTFATAGELLVAGDRIVTLREAKADVRFANGCIASLAESSILAIDGEGSCRAGKEPVKVAQALGGRTDVPIGNGDLPVAGGLPPMTPLLAGASFLAGGAVLNKDFNGHHHRQGPISGQ